MVIDWNAEAEALRIAIAMLAPWFGLMVLFATIGFLAPVWISMWLDFKRKRNEKSGRFEED